MSWLRMLHQRPSRLNRSEVHHVSYYLDTEGTPKKRLQVRNTAGKAIPTVATHVSFCYHASVAAFAGRRHLGRFKLSGHPRRFLPLPGRHVLALMLVVVGVASCQ